jgi:hypothetical protein
MGVDRSHELRVSSPREPVPDVCQFDLAVLEHVVQSPVLHEECMVKGGTICRFKFSARSARIAHSASSPSPWRYEVTAIQKAGRSETFLTVLSPYHTNPFDPDQRRELLADEA